jgi:hypothetical protein
MKLKNAARVFDTCPVYDGYTGAPLFKVQTSTFLESSPEGSTAARRAVSLAPELTPPAHSCVLALGQLWLFGGENPDEWAGTAIRKAYWTKRVTDQFQMLTPAEAVALSAGTVAYGCRKFLRETVNTPTDSQLDPMWDIAMSRSLKPARASYLKSGTSLYRVRMVYEDLDGFTTCQSDEVDEPVRQITFMSDSNYDPVTDSHSPLTVNTRALLLDYAKAFVRSEATERKFEAGDLVAVVSSAAVLPAVGQKIRVEVASKYAGDWQVLAVTPELDAKGLHIRRL